MPLLGGITGFIDKYLLGYALGTAAGPALQPYAQKLANEGWQARQDMPLRALDAAHLVATGERDLSWGVNEVSNVGVNPSRFAALVDLADTAPDLGTLYRLLHRQQISPTKFQQGAKRAGIEDDYLNGLLALAEARLTPADVANAVQQGFVPNAGLLPPDPGGAPPFTPPIEEVPIDTLQEFAAAGVPKGRAAVLAQLVGLPPGPMELLQMWNRGIITETAVERGIREGHTKTKWTSALKEFRHFLVSPQEAAGLRLRGWITKGEAEKLGALRGASPEVMENLYLNRGRPATTRQVHIGYARGAKLPGAANEEEAIRTAVKQSNIRTEYADLLYAQRFTYPSAFVIRALAQDGTFPPALTETILVESGWRPEWAKLAAGKWGGAAGAGPSTKWADRARSRLFTALHSDYVDGGADEAVTREGLTRVGATGAEQNAIVVLWEWERQNVRRDLTQAQILKLYKKAIWTREQAQAALEDMGMEAGDAADLLDAV